MRDKSYFLPIDQFSLYKTYLFTHKYHILHLHPPISDKKELSSVFARQPIFTIGLTPN